MTKQIPQHLIAPSTHYYSFTLLLHTISLYGHINFVALPMIYIMFFVVINSINLHL